MVWIAVTKRFSNLNDALQLEPETIDDGLAKCRRITKTLNKQYWEEDDSEDNHRFVVGSWGKNTAIKPAIDVDMFYVLPASVYHRFNSYSGNKQSSLLQEVKNSILVTVPQTDMRGDGQVVQVKFNTIMVEVVPAFKVEDGTYVICDTNNGGKWQTVDPQRELDTLSQSDRDNAHNTRPLLRMVKAWRDYCNVEIKSYVLESLVVRFFEQYEFSRCSFYWYDWFCRDFFAYLSQKENQFIQTLDGGWHAMGNEWKSRADSAYSRSLKACDHERADEVISAGLEWQKIFGSSIEQNP